jgi:hypothetical protein
VQHVKHGIWSAIHGLRGNLQRNQSSLLLQLPACHLRPDSHRFNPSLATRLARRQVRRGLSCPKTQSAANNSFGGTSSSGSNLFGGTPAPAPASQQLQLTTGSTDKSIPSRATLFGKPNLSFAPFSQYGTTTSNQFPSEALKASHTGGLFGQAPNPQHKLQAPSHDPFAPSGSEPKIPKLKAESSPTNGILATNGPQSNVPLFGRPANGSTTPGFSFSNL